MPNRSTWLAPIITCRLPPVTIARCWRYGSQPSISSDAPPIAGTSPISIASPSVSSRSGEKVSFASRAPIAGTVPIGLARISPSPRQASAHATTQYSARVTPDVSFAFMRPPS